MWRCIYDMLAAMLRSITLTQSLRQLRVAVVGEAASVRRLLDRAGAVVTTMSADELRCPVSCDVAIVDLLVAGALDLVQDLRQRRIPVIVVAKSAVAGVRAILRGADDFVRPGVALSELAGLLGRIRVRTAALTSSFASMPCVIAEDARQRTYHVLARVDARVQAAH